MESIATLSTPEEELAYLRERVARQEQELALRQSPGQATPERAQVISEQIQAHHAAPEEVLAPAYRISEATKTSEAEAILAELHLGGSEQAVKQFQINHGLAASGKTDKATLAALNVSAATRLATLRANLPRVAEYAKDLGPRYIVVNVPALQLEAVENGRVYSRHNVIAGKPERPSPIVMANLSDINFNPYWNVPVSIVERDLIPQILKGGTQTLKKQNIRIYDGYQGPEVDPDDVDWSSTPAER